MKLALQPQTQSFAEFHRSQKENAIVPPNVVRAALAAKNIDITGIPDDVQMTRLQLNEALVTAERQQIKLEQ